jgi:hypothetical protein
MTPNQEPRRPLVGLASIVVGVGFNLPYLQLVASYDYPDILRRPAAEALDRFAAGGPGLILTWHGFALAALAMAPLAVALAVTPTRIAARPGLAIGASIFGALAGVMQAVGLWRWVFVVPSLASAHAAPEASAEAMRAAEGAFEILNLYGGVAIGEHLGQLLTALFVVCLGALQALEGRRIVAGIGFVSAAAIAAGTGEGLAIALGRAGDAFALGTIAGYLGLTLWLVATGAMLLRAR